MSDIKQRIIRLEKTKTKTGFTPAQLKRMAKYLQGTPLPFKEHEPENKKKSVIL